MNPRKNFSIEDYALIGDCHGCALISRHGDVEWLTLVRFDNSPDLWSLLDQEKGSHFSIDLPEGFTWSRRYIDKTNILITEAQNGKSLLRLTDFMPVGRKEGSSTHDYTRLTSLHGFCRKVEVFGSPLKIKFSFAGGAWPLLERGYNPLFLYQGSEEISRSENKTWEVEVSEGVPYFTFLSRHEHLKITNNRMEEILKTTVNFWKEWIDYSQYSGDHADQIERSALTLKMLFHASTGAIIAAPTTSLPETPGGERNWDYRYCWLRDSTFALYALSYLGFSGEADRFSDYLQNLKNSSGGQLQVLYSLDGSAELPEKCVEGISGFKDSRPVRVGNSAYLQRQLDTYGEFVDWAYLHQSINGVVGPELKNDIRETAEWVSRSWKLKDKGLWEIREEAQDYTYSKVMCWVALDRAEAILEETDLYQEQKQEIVKFVQEQCVSQGQLKCSAQNDDLDASLLLLKFVGFPLADDVYEKTVDAILEELGDGMFVKRYRYQDGLGGKEGSFVICSFWAINALLMLDRYEEANHRFHVLTKSFNDLGLISEEIDLNTGHFLGNYPQALSHLALIETASYFELYRKGGKEALVGCHADRARRLNQTLHGPGAVWNFIRKTGKIRKLFPSQDSILKLA